MDRSFGASTTTLPSPSPADRNSRPFEPRHSPPSNPLATPGRSVSTLAGATNAAAGGAPISATTTKAVRFSPSYAPIAPAASGSAFGSSYTPTSIAPATRLQSFTPASRTPTRYPGPTPPRSLFTPTQQQEVKGAAPSPRVPQKEDSRVVAKAVPLGRGQVAKRLRVNSVLLVMWWISSRTNVYGFASGHIVQIVPSLDTPLHFLESLCLMLLFYNIADSMWRLNRLSSLPPPPPRSPPRSPTRPSTSTFTPSSRATPTAFGTTPLSRSSPKTRPSPSPSSPAASPFRSALRNSPAALSPAPTTPLFRRSLLSSSTGSPSKEGESTSSVLSAYMARHSPMASSLHRSVNSREAINRLLDD